MLFQYLKFVTALALLPSSSLTYAAAGSIVSTADSRLPMSLTTVITDLEAEGCDELSTACLITSKSVTRPKRIALLESLLGIDHTEEEDAGGSADTWKAVATTAGLALAQPTSPHEVASTACVCGGTILYYADAVDLERGEGLFDSLAPAMETILKQKEGNAETGAQLYVIGNEKDVKARLEEVASSFLATLVASSTVKTLRDVFDKVVYVSPAEALKAVTDATEDKTTPSDVASLVASTVSGSSLSFSTTVLPELSASNLAAARTLGPASRVQLTKTVNQVKEASTDPQRKEPMLVTNFGDLCDAAVTRAMDELQDNSPAVLQSALGKQIRSNLLAELNVELSNLFEDQLDLLQEASFDEFKKRLSKLLVSPNLGSDMESKMRESIAAFAKASKKLVAQKHFASSWSTAPAQHAYRRRLKDYISNRLLAAQAGGQFKPLPRKGVTVGLHWLLPKPFGNDFRQEPWMVHATDNLVYVPRDKVTDVSPEEVAAGDWRSKIVPSPAGNDMVYMQ